jgi:hypothetical protein
MKSLIYFAQNVTIDTSPLPGSKLTTSKFQTGVDVFLAVAGAVALLIITIAGLRMVMSRGNPQAIAQARSAILYTVVGLIIMIMAFTIVTFVLNGI